MEQKVQIPESVTRRAEELRERQEARKKGLEDDTNKGAWFRKKFIDGVSDIESRLQDLEEKGGSFSREEIGSRLNDIEFMISTLNKTLSTYSSLLIPYDVKRSTDILIELKKKMIELEGKLLPKKKFGFSNKKSVKPVEHIENNHVQDLEIEDSIPKKITINERIFLSQEDVKDKEINFSDMEGCTVVIKGSPKALSLSSLSDCVIACGPVVSSALLYNLNNCTVAVACQQLRVHGTTGSYFYIHVTASAIIEDCRDVGFSPYTFSYLEIEDHYRASGLDRKVNNWDKVKDFNWLVPNHPSPNWRIIPEGERKSSWPG